MSLALLEPVISPDSRQEPGINDEQGRMKLSRKSSTATTVTTLTSILPTVADNSVEDSPLPLESAGIRGQHSTMQIVHSRDSVYEIIWQNLAPTTGEAEEGTGAADALAKPDITCIKKTIVHNDGETKLAAWV